VALAGDGQVSLGDTIIKSKAKKIRRLHDNQVLAFPFEWVRCGSDECSNGVLAVLDSIQGGDWEDPTTIKQLDHDINDVGLREFCDTHGIKYTDAGRWYLTAYWG